MNMEPRCATLLSAWLVCIVHLRMAIRPERRYPGVRCACCNAMQRVAPAVKQVDGPSPPVRLPQLLACCWLQDAMMASAASVLYVLLLLPALARNQSVGYTPYPYLPYNPSAPAAPAG